MFTVLLFVFFLCVTSECVKLDGKHENDSGKPQPIRKGQSAYRS